MIIVLAKVHTRPEALAELLAASHEHVARSRDEPGCLEHGVYQEPDAPHRLVFVEKWIDRSALATHIALPASQAFGKLARRLAAEAIDMQVFAAQSVSF